jgi:hypothetical protein
MKKNHAFHPALDGRLEDRLVLSGADVARVAAQIASVDTVSARQTSLEKATQFTTLRYYNIVTNIHNAVKQYGQSDGNPNDYNRLLNKIYNQVRFIPYAIQDELVSTLRFDLVGATPADSQQIYSIVRTDVLDFIDFQVSSGAMTVVKSKGPSHWTDQEILGLTVPI